MQFPTIKPHLYTFPTAMQFALTRVDDANAALHAASNVADRAAALAKAIAAAETALSIADQWKAYIHDANLSYPELPNHAQG